MQEQEAFRTRLEEYFRQVNSLGDQFTNKLTDVPTFVTHVAEFLYRSYQAALEIEQRDTRKFEERVGNVESLTTDTVGKRSQHWFATTKKQFATGVAHSCLACSVVHPYFGMGASHRNPISIDIATKSVQQVAEAFKAGRRLNFRGITDMLTQQDLESFTQTTVGDALEQFYMLVGSNVALRGQMSVTLAGMDFLSPQTKNLVIRSSVNTVQRSLQSLSNRVELKVEFNSRLGSPGGIIYGGRNHPSLNKPQFYALQ